MPLEQPSVGAADVSSAPSAPAAAPSNPVQQARQQAASPAPAARTGMRPSEAMDRMLAGIDESAFTPKQPEPAPDTPRDPQLLDPEIENPLEQNDTQVDENAEERQQTEPEEELEQLYDDNGDPIDMKAYAEQLRTTYEAAKKGIREGRLPDELLNLQLEYTVNGETRVGTIGEMRNQQMLHATFSRRMTEVANIERQATQMMQTRRAEIEAWRRDPRELRASMEIYGLTEAFEAAAQAWARERVEYLDLSPAEQRAIDQSKLLARERQRLAWREQQLSQQAQQQQRAAGPDEVTQHVFSQLKQLMPQALREAGQPIYPYAQQIFLQQLPIFAPDGVITPERARDAAIATKQFLDDLADRRAARSQQPQQSDRQAPASEAPAQGRKPMAARRLPGGGGVARPRGELNGGSSNGARKTGVRPSEAARRLGW